MYFQNQDKFWLILSFSKFDKHHNKVYHFIFNILYFVVYYVFVLPLSSDKMENRRRNIGHTVNYYVKIIVEN